MASLLRPFNGMFLLTPVERGHICLVIKFCEKLVEYNIVSDLFFLLLIKLCRSFLEIHRTEKDPKQLFPSLLFSISRFVDGFHIFSTDKV